ncbi:hypothetical protein EW146_g875 [Bondarzewia mesenterica]|uniref:Uncharacterized protein n=1 Tax=Bondarzewia mesenterica TaxID=1095465 RepID=A0A4S4M5P5_9AGAM|nr:hypothetical protein EW146_g875 [Bondarzewia mesenterica]
MLVKSVTQRGQDAVSGQVLILNCGGKKVLVEVPESFAKLERLARDVFSVAQGALVLETDDLDICQGTPIYIHSSAWNQVKYCVGTVAISVQNQGLVDGIDEKTTVPAVARASTAKPESVNINTSLGVSAGPSSLAHIRRGDSSSHPPVEGQFDVPDSRSENAPVRDYLDEEDYEEQPISPLKGKGRARNQILSDDEEDDAKENIFIATSPLINRPASARMSVQSTYGGTPASTKKRVSRPPASALSPLFPRNDVNDMFSPKGKTASYKMLATSPDTGADSADENKAGGSTDTYEMVTSPRAAVPSRQAPKALHRDEDLFERAKASPVQKQIYRPDIASPKQISPSKWTSQSVASQGESDAPSTAKPKFKPQLLKQSPVLSADKTQGHVQMPSQLDDKILITIAHPPTGQENKFKIKGRHVVERVLISACNAFKLDYERARLVLQEADESEDEMELMMECSNEDTMTKAGAYDGSMFIIKLDGEQ